MYDACLEKDANERLEQSTTHVRSTTHLEICVKKEVQHIRKYI